jgi:UDP-3-O-[3-hydroxymyristoyl] glucosamine N-acyltransferase
MEPLSLGELASRVDGRVGGDEGFLVEAIASLEEAGPRHLSFLTNPRYREAARRTRAGAVLVGEGVELPGVNLLVARDPYLALSRLIEIFHPRTRPPEGIAHDAAIGADCVIDPSASVAARAVVGDRCRLGSRSVVMSGAVIGSDVSIGEDTWIHPNVTVYDGCVLGRRVTVHAGTVIGSDGFGFAREGRRYVKIPQVGNVIVKDDVEIGANTTVDRATLGSTVIDEGVKIDNLVQIGHNVRIGRDSILVAQVGISGSTRLGEGVTFAGQSGAVGHISIGDGAIVGAKSAVTRDVRPGAFVIGHPAIEAGSWKKAVAIIARLPELRRRLMRLERHSPGAGREPKKEA